MSKFHLLREHSTSAPNYDITTEQVIETLSKWDDAYGIRVSDVGEDRVTVNFERLPEDLDALAHEIYEFCPDTVTQGFECFPDMLEHAEDLDPEVVANIRELADGVDFNDADFGFQLLKKSLRKDRAIGLWWD
jgi:hypothetical protein